MGDEEEETEPKYELYVKGTDKPREDGSQKFTGQGRAAYLNGDSYAGTYVEGIRAGKGVYTFKKFGDSYEGDYQENRKHGFGKMTYRNNPTEGEDEEPPEEENVVARGGTYLGHFTAGQRGRGVESPPETASEGTFTYVNGDTYVGQWQDGKKTWQGRIHVCQRWDKAYWRLGNRQNGQWQVDFSEWDFLFRQIQVQQAIWKRRLGLQEWQSTDWQLRAERAGERR